MDPEGSRNVVSAAFVSIASALVLVSAIFVLRFPPGYESDSQTVSVGADTTSTTEPPTTASTTSVDDSADQATSSLVTDPGPGDGGPSIEPDTTTTLAPDDSTTVPEAEPVATPSGPTTYRVEPGDTLSAIADQFGTNVAEIVRLNGIADPNLIFPGQVFRVLDVGTQPTTVGVAGFDETPFVVTAANVGLEPELLMAVAWVSSGWDPNAASGGVGIGQLDPEVHQFVERELVDRSLSTSDEADSIEAMGAYLAWLFEQSGGETSSALAAYHENLLTARNIGWGDDTLAFVDQVRTARSQFVNRS